MVTRLALPASVASRIIDVGISDLKVTNDSAATLVTYSLGSCIAVIVHEATRNVGGMIHFQLPLSTTNPEKAALTPAMFADTGLPLLFEGMYAFGCRKKDIVVKVTGGSNPRNSEGFFDIGRRNYTVLRKIFLKNSIVIAAEDVGGALARTARLHVGSGRVTITAAGQTTEL